MYAILLFLLLTSNCFADVFVVYNPTTKEVDSLSSIDDAVVPQGFDKKVIKGNVEDYYSQADAKDFKFNDNKLTLNAKKITDRALAKEDRENKKSADRRSAIDKLKTLGLKDAEIDALLGR